MRRLDSAIRRLQAQRACLQAAVDLVQDLPGPIFELGLGNGRTYDHLRSLCPEREIFVFERQLAAHPDCIPDDAHLFLGDLRDTLPQAARRFGGAVALLHADIGSGDTEASAEIAALVAQNLAALMRPGGVVLGDQAMSFPGGRPLALPDGVKPGRYCLLSFEEVTG